MSTEIKSFSLYELTSSIRRCLSTSFSGRYWVRAETSDVRLSGASGHCYLELLEKGKGGEIRARIRASIWAGIYSSIAQRLQTAGVSPLTSGMGILALVEVTYHEQYGMSLIIHDIDPSYSLGEIARLRQQTIERLRREGIMDDNKTLTLPHPLRRLAIISSPTAAGLGDFMDQLHRNRLGLPFYTALFSAQMQGDGTTHSVIAALGRILPHTDLFDAVVIIRGGGAVSELRAFDSYELCAACAQYPLPILCGIGHERDQSVLDLVAHTSLKTPTAVAEYLIQSLTQELTMLEGYSQRLKQGTQRLVMMRHQRLDNLAYTLPRLVSRRLGHAREELAYRQMRLERGVRRHLQMNHQRLESYRERLGYACRTSLLTRSARLDQLTQRLPMLISQRREAIRLQLERYEQAIRLAHPDNVLARGFALIERDGAIITDAKQLKEGDTLNIRLGKHSAEAQVTKSNP